ncbi:hypothetical protein SAMN04487788_2697 [Microbacterium testaceum StLB037]|jgi:hypothetical protein|uniref:DUF3558 domain-containing protein n=1 Tax=Microbacterium testaceum (strain StLB037) TaxID=979556 RepID=A0A1H0R6B1_MICTS|nr:MULTISPECIES: hypothetical protein [Microbacterium]KQM39874.1 hypothetical protein ASE56_05615 [Microbacterium sp. Leaf203]SDP25027.1 hypothetical protein SAMN04487788_2697 [Microbacterium testaceum StLB037]
MSRRLLRPAVAAALAGATLLALSACAPAADDAAPTPAAPVVSSSPTPIPTITQTAPAVRIPADCRSMLSADVLAQLGQTPLNDPALGPSGVQSDGSLICIWRDPAADTTGLVTHISRMDRGPALDMLNGLVDTQGFSCYTPDAGTRCEKTWINPTYPVNDGRTLYWRDGVLIDTQYSNLAPTGYTGSIIASVFGG